MTESIDQADSGHPCIQDQSTTKCVYLCVIDYLNIVEYICPIITIVCDIKSVKYRQMSSLYNTNL